MRKNKAIYLVVHKTLFFLRKINALKYERAEILL